MVLLDSIPTPDTTSPFQRLWKVMEGKSEIGIRTEGTSIFMREHKTRKLPELFVTNME